MEDLVGYSNKKRKIIKSLVFVLLIIVIGFIIGFFVVKYSKFFFKKNANTSSDNFSNEVLVDKNITTGIEQLSDGASAVSSLIDDKKQIENNYVAQSNQDKKSDNVDTNLAKNSEYNKLVEKLATSVVHIKMISLKDTEVNDRYELLYALGGEVFPDTKIKTMGSCSGFFISSDGYVATNHHCIDDVKDIDVETKNGNKYSAKVIGYFEGADLAILKIQPRNGEKFNAVKIGDSDKLSVGDNVIIIGGPLGYKWSASSGIVSGKARDVDYNNNQSSVKKHAWGTAGELIQVDAAVNPGNSGGPAFNLKGEVVGIASSGFTYLQGMNFIVSSNTLKEYLPGLKKGKIIQKGLWGININELQSYDIKAVGLPKNSGMLIHNVLKFSPAEKAGLKRGDIITKVDDVEIKDLTAMRAINSKVFDGSVSKIEVNRYGKYMSFKVKAISVREIEKLEKGEIGIQEWNDKNISYRLLTSKKHNDFRFPKDVHGIIVTGIKNNNDPMLILAIGDVIMGVNDKDINSIEDYQAIIKKLKKQKKDMAIFHIYKPVSRKIVVEGSKFE